MDSRTQLIENNLTNITLTLQELKIIFERSIMGWVLTAINQDEKFSMLITDSDMPYQEEIIACIRDKKLEELLAKLDKGETISEKAIKKIINFVFMNYKNDVDLIDKMIVKVNELPSSKLESDNPEKELPTINTTKLDSEEFIMEPSLQEILEQEFIFKNIKKDETRRIKDEEIKIQMADMKAFYNSCLTDKKTAIQKETVDDDDYNCGALSDYDSDDYEGGSEEEEELEREQNLIAIANDAIKDLIGNKQCELYRNGNNSLYIEFKPCLPLEAMYKHAETLRALGLSVKIEKNYPAQARMTLIPAKIIINDNLQEVVNTFISSISSEQENLNNNTFN